MLGQATVISSTEYSTKPIYQIDHVKARDGYQRFGIGASHTIH